MNLAKDIFMNVEFKGCGHDLRWQRTEGDKEQWVKHPETGNSGKTLLLPTVNGQMKGMLFPELGRKVCSVGITIIERRWHCQHHSQLRKWNLGYKHGIKKCELLHDSESLNNVGKEFKNLSTKLPKTRVEYWAVSWAWGNKNLISVSISHIWALRELYPKNECEPDVDQGLWKLQPGLLTRLR